MNVSSAITVSVLVPSFNHGPFLRECIDSVLSQDYPGVEVIVVDDGSTDNSIEILREYGDRITLIQQSRGRQARARNLGLEIAKGDLIAFLDSDDRYLPGRISSAVDVFMEDPEAVLVWGDYRLIDGSNKVFSTCRWKPCRADFRLELIAGNPICNATVTVRKETLLAIGGFEESLARACDGLAWYIIAARGGKFVHVAKELVDYRLHDRNDSNNFTTMSRERDAALLAAVRAYIDYGVVSGRDELLWLRNVVMKQFAFRSAAYLQGIVSKTVSSRIKSTLLRCMDSDGFYLCLTALKRIKNLSNTARTG